VSLRETDKEKERKKERKIVFMSLRCLARILKIYVTVRRK